MRFWSFSMVWCYLLPRIYLHSFVVILNQIILSCCCLLCLYFEASKSFSFRILYKFPHKISTFLVVTKFKIHDECWIELILSLEKVIQGFMFIVKKILMIFSNKRSYLKFLCWEKCQGMNFQNNRTHLFLPNSFTAVEISNNHYFSMPGG